MRVPRSRQGSVKAVANATFILALTGPWLDLSWRLGKERNNLIFFLLLNNTSSITLLSAVNLLDCCNCTFHFEEKGRRNLCVAVLLKCRCCNRNTSFILPIQFSEVIVLVFKKLFHYPHLIFFLMSQ